MNFHPAFSSPAQKFNLFGGQVLGAHHGGGAVLFLKPLIHNQPLLAEFLGHGCARIRRWMLNIRPVHITAGKFEIGFNRLARIARAADDQSAHHIHLVAMQIIDGFQCCIASRGPPSELSLMDTTLYTTARAQKFAQRLLI